MVKDFFEKYSVSFQNVIVPQQLLELGISDAVIEYLSCMGRDLSFYVSPNGVAATRLYSVKTIMEEAFEEYNKPCIENGYLIIGDGANGDLLCVDIQKSTVGYAYHDDLWERNFKDFDHIYIHMPITIDAFIEMMLKDESNYPFDGYEAEKYID